MNEVERDGSTTRPWTRSDASRYNPPDVFVVVPHPHDIATHRGGLVSARPRLLRHVAASAAALSLVAAPAADEFIAQLSRSDTMPNRSSPG